MSSVESRFRKRGLGYVHHRNGDGTVWQIHTTHSYIDHSVSVHFIAASVQLASEPGVLFGFYPFKHCVSYPLTGDIIISECECMRLYTLYIPNSPEFDNEFMGNVIYKKDSAKNWTMVPSVYRRRWWRQVHVVHSITNNAA